MTIRNYSSGNNLTLTTPTPIPHKVAQSVLAMTFLPSTIAQKLDLPVTIHSGMSFQTTRDDRTLTATVEQNSSVKIPVLLNDLLNPDVNVLSMDIDSAYLNSLFNT